MRCLCLLPTVLNIFPVNLFQPAVHLPQQQLHLGDRLSDLLGQAGPEEGRAEGQPHPQGQARRHRRPAEQQERQIR